MRGVIDAQFAISHRRYVVQTVVDVHESKPQLVHQGWREQMGFSGVKKASIDRSIEWEVQRRGADATRERAAQRFLEISGAKRKEAFGIRKEKAGGELV